MNRSESLSKWKARHAILVWLGIAMNLVYAIPLIFWPEWILGVFHIPSTPGLMIWTRFSAILLLILSVFYVPATLDIDRYRIFAWLAVFPSRTFGAVFFFLAVFLFGQPLGFLMGVLLDGTVAILTLWCLMRIVALEQEIAGGKA